MMMLSSLKRGILTGTAVVLLPATVFAATPQQLLNTALKNNLKAPYRMNAEIKIDITDQPVIRTERIKTANVVMRLTQRVQSEAVGSETSEGTFTISSFRASGERAADPDLTLTSPVVIEWKGVNRIAYFNIRSLPSQLVESFSVLGIDFPGIVNQWMKIDMSDSEDSILSQLPLAPELPIDPPKSDFSISELLNLSKIQPVIVSRIESTKKSVDGREILRLRVRMNPVFINELQRIERSKIGAKDTDRAQKITELNEKYAKIRKFMANLHLVMEVDSANQRLTRIELGGKQTEPVKTCTTNERTRREICKTVSYKTTQYAIGINLETDNGTPIIPPTDAVDLMSILSQLTPTE